MGMIVPIVGYYSDRTWAPKLGGRRLHIPDAWYDRCCYRYALCQTQVVLALGMDHLRH